MNKANLQLVGPRTPADCTQPAAPNPATDAIVQADNAAGGVVNLLADGIRFQRFTVQNNTLGSGVFTGASFSGHQVQQNLVQNNVLGVYFNSNGATDSAATQNCIRQNNQAGAAAGNGIYSDLGLSDADIAQNTFFDNDSSAIVLTGGAPGAVDDVDIDANTSQQDGSLLAVFNSADTKVRWNNARNNTGSAIFAGNDNTALQILSNNVTGSGRGVRSSIDFGGGPSTDVRISSNSISNSTSTDGISVGPNSLTGSVISANFVTNNPRNGIRIEAGGNTGNQITGNTLRNNLEHDCHDDTVGAGTAGTANTWRYDSGVTENRPGLCRGTPS
ncbi:MULTISPECIES: right-handed parallel beta-helix repeat-containing protein [unclassified Streptomyces]|uniref:right-handed parallel beta-helix repeat-containing protein n=1 Tax=unclassified Streptomyces TaxID=2593676 RepID=UPI0004BD0B9A|nr:MULTISPECIES: right-handed parallel beta-helix repeat-containing protein [unclassified Streptomyces]